ncbi:unnamed protein product [Ectocarpus sp. 12 AP-2014]
MRGNAVNVLWLDFPVESRVASARWIFPPEPRYKLGTSCIADEVLASYRRPDPFVRGSCQRGNVLHAKVVRLQQICAIRYRVLQQETTTVRVQRVSLTHCCTCRLDTPSKLPEVEAPAGICRDSGL